MYQDSGEQSRALGPPFLCMDESFHDFSLIQDFEADFPRKVSLKC